MAVTFFTFLGPYILLMCSFHVVIFLKYSFIEIKSSVFFQEILMKPKESTRVFKVCILIDKCGQTNSIHTLKSGDNIKKHLLEVQKNIISLF